MRAYIDYSEDGLHSNDRAWVCVTPATGNQVDDGFDAVKMDPKPYYIEYPEEEMDIALTLVRVNITGLDSYTVADLITTLREGGYEAVLEMDPKFQLAPQPVVPQYPYIQNDKWYTAPPLVTNVYGSANTE
jgi:hypothetical protein